MILLVSGSIAAEQCASKMQHELRTRVSVAKTLQQASTLLRKDSYDVVMIDEALVEQRQSAVDSAMKYAHSAVPVYFNPAIHGLDRIIREAHAALQRRERERKAALEFALEMLRNDLTTEVTAILLNSQLAVKNGDPDRMKNVCEMAERLSRKLE